MEWAVIKQEKQKMVNGTTSRKLYSGGFNDFLALGNQSQAKLSNGIKSSMNMYSGYQQILAFNSSNKRKGKTSTAAMPLPVLEEKPSESLGKGLAYN